MVNNNTIKGYTYLNAFFQAITVVATMQSKFLLFKKLPLPGLKQCMASLSSVGMPLVTIASTRLRIEVLSL